MKDTRSRLEKFGARHPILGVCLSLAVFVPIAVVLGKQVGWGAAAGIFGFGCAGYATVIWLVVRHDRKDWLD